MKFFLATIVAVALLVDGSHAYELPDEKESVGYRPFRGEGEEVMRQIRYGEYKFHQRYWSDISDEAKILISRMLTVDPQRRITAEEALQSSWIASADEDYYDDEEEEEEEIVYKPKKASKKKSSGKKKKSSDY